MSYRLFAALPVPEAIRDTLTAMQAGLDGAKWRHAENFHITLRFYGDLTDERARDLDADLARIDLPKIPIRLKTVGQFGGFDPHAVWVGVENNELLTRLAAKCDSAAARLKLKRDKHGFRPHITLAYLSNISPEAVAAYVQRHAMFEAPEFYADRFVLYSSWPTKHQSRYQEEASYPLV